MNTLTKIATDLLFQKLTPSEARQVLTLVKAYDPSAKRAEVAQSLLLVDEVETHVATLALQYLDAVRLVERVETTATLASHDQSGGGDDDGTPARKRR